MNPLAILAIIGVGVAAVVASSGSSSGGSSRGGTVRPDCRVQVMRDEDLTPQEKAIVQDTLNDPNKKAAIGSVLADMGYDDDPDGIRAFQEDLNSWVAYQMKMGGKKMRGVVVDGKMNLPTILALVGFSAAQFMAASKNISLDDMLQWTKGIDFCK